MEASESLVYLLQLAHEDSDIFEQLSFILSLEPFHRKSALNSLVDEMKIKGAPEEIVAAMSILLDNKIAQKAKEIMHQG